MWQVFFFKKKSRLKNAVSSYFYNTKSKKCPLEWVEFSCTVIVSHFLNWLSRVSWQMSHAYQWVRACFRSRGGRAIFPKCSAPLELTVRPRSSVLPISSAISALHAYLIIDKGWTKSDKNHDFSWFQATSDTYTQNWKLKKRLKYYSTTIIWWLKEPWVLRPQLGSESASAPYFSSYSSISDFSATIVILSGWQCVLRPVRSPPWIGATGVLMSESIETCMSGRGAGRKVGREASAKSLVSSDSESSPRQIGGGSNYR